MDWSFPGFWLDDSGGCAFDDQFSVKQEQDDVEQVTMIVLKLSK
jgi:hypothetical protein